MPPTFLALLAERGPMASRELLVALGVSQPSLSRLVAAAGGQVLRIGRARATRYALRRDLPGEGNSWPVYRIDRAGRPSLLGTLHALAPRGWWFEVVGGRPPWLRGEFVDGLFGGLPWVLAGLRPEGFLGRAFGRLHGAELGMAVDPTRWSDDDALRTMLRFGDDLPGDLVVGDVALRRFLENPGGSHTPIAGPDRGSRYDDLADAAMAGDIAGSSAGGEQPKFCVRVDDGEGPRHLLVKFSPPRDSPPGRRWADLLVCEHLAACVLRDHAIAAARTSLFETSSRTYLEVERFDRAGERGRSGLVSLLSLDAAFYGVLDDWVGAANRLERDGWLDAGDAGTLRMLHWFGTFLANSDMHFANAGLELADTLPLRLAPSYDMLPMQLRPAPSGEVTTRPLAFPLPLPADRDAARRAAVPALAFWQRVAADGRISQEFRSAVAGAEEMVRRAVD